jgi:hypothetical protein
MPFSVKWLLRHAVNACDAEEEPNYILDEENILLFVL